MFSASCLEFLILTRYARKILGEESKYVLHLTLKKHSNERPNLTIQ